MNKLFNPDVKCKYCGGDRNPKHSFFNSHECCFTCWKEKKYENCLVCGEKMSEEERKYKIPICNNCATNSLKKAKEVYPSEKILLKNDLEQASLKNLRIINHLAKISDLTNNIKEDYEMNGDFKDLKNGLNQTQKLINLIIGEL